MSYYWLSVISSIRSSVMTVVRITIAIVSKCVSSFMDTRSQLDTYSLGLACQQDPLILLLTKSLLYESSSKNNPTSWVLDIWKIDIKRQVEWASNYQDDLVGRFKNAVDRRNEITYLTADQCSDFLKDNWNNLLQQLKQELKSCENAASVYLKFGNSTRI